MSREAAGVRNGRAGVFIVLEGIDGTGKTTQTRWLVERLEAEGLPAKAVKEPTDGFWGQKIREIARRGRDHVSPEEELDYFVRDRAEDVEQNIRPALADGFVVVADRYFYSTIAYQSALGLDPNHIRALNADFPVPDLMLLLEIPVELSRERITQGRNQVANRGYEQLDYLQRVKAAYEALTDPNIVRVNAAQDPPAVREAVWQAVADLLRVRRPGSRPKAGLGGAGSGPMEKNH
jgi:dTMP kinase